MKISKIFFLIFSGIDCKHIGGEVHFHNTHEPSDVSNNMAVVNLATRNQQIQSCDSCTNSMVRINARTQLGKANEQKGERCK